MTRTTGDGEAAGFRFVPVPACPMCRGGREAFRLLGHRLDRHQGFFSRRQGRTTVPVKRCRRCGVVFPDPMPLPLRAADNYELDPSSYWPPAYFVEDPAYLDRQCQIAKELLGPDTGRRALDVGAGIGKGVVALRRHGFDAVGLEPSAHFRAAAMERLGLSADDLLAVTVEGADLPLSSFDYIHVSAVLEHLPDPHLALERILGWLKPGGVAHAEVPNAEWLLARGLNAWYRITGQGLVTNTSPMHPPYHLVEFTVRSFHLALAGLPARVERSEVWVANVLGPRLLRGVLRRAMQATRTGMQLAVWIRRT